MEPVFSIKLSESQLSLLNAIKEYLKDNLDLDTYSLNKLECSSVISIGKGKAVNNSKPLATLTIKNTHFLNNVFVPFFDEMKFISKKGLDFKDFKLICHAIFIGAYRTERIKGLLIKLSMTMNNFRLSDYKGEKVNISLVEINEILDAEATIEHFSDGRELDINTKKLIHRRSSSSVFEILSASGEIIIKPNLADSAKEIGVGFNTLKRQLDNYIQEVEYKEYRIKRIGVFKKKM
uniref:LAGLIDADG endonuclease n=2 Tax=Monilinia fructicola TaxID=38448 RepID=A0A889XQ74_MONFR|nr:LAGLIDADG endonuclease [Monilinia fructicola]QRF72253.1 LAGLIDADG endonuclease [Monilinia fructicola]